ncbi:hypothetical protein M0804_013479 [Polistes exclamans]|nr:hypothetical protein M0804_013479 [Polistes exclamans]
MEIDKYFKPLNAEEIDFSSTSNALELTERAMKLMGTWPLKSFEPIFIFFFSYLIIHCTSALIVIAFNLSNMEYVNACLMENVFNMTAVLKMSICKIKRKTLSNFLEDIKPDFNENNYNSNEEKVAFINYNKCSRNFVITLLVASFGASTMYYSLSLAVNVKAVLGNSSYGCRLPYKVWLFIEPTNVLTYICLCCYQALIIPCIFLGYVGTDCLFICLVLHVSGLFSALSHKIKYVLNDSSDHQRNLRQLIIKHVRLIR